MTSNAWVKKIVENPVIKPNKADNLQNLADDVRCCMETLNAMNKLAEVESQDRMVKISKGCLLLIIPVITLTSRYSPSF